MGLQRVTFLRACYALEAVRRAGSDSATRQRRLSVSVTTASYYGGRREMNTPGARDLNAGTAIASWLLLRFGLKRFKQRSAVAGGYRQGVTGGIMRGGRNRRAKAVKEP